MKRTVIMPDLGQTTAEGRVAKWHKRPGDRVAKGEFLLAVETDKVTMDVESYEAGYLRACLVAEGGIASALSPIAILTDAPDEPYADAEPAGAASTKAPSDEVPSVQSRTAAIAAGHAPEFLVRGGLLTPEQKMAMYRRMVLCRLFEEKVYYLFLEGRLPGTIHQSQGQEASAVGVCSALAPGDMITSTHRPHAHAIARGLPVNDLMAELFAKETGCCHGKGGSMHVGDAARGMLPAIAIVGGGIPLAAGYALAFQSRQQPNVVACFFGEGAANIGSFHEAVNMAAIWDLPVVFICENNGYAASTPVEKAMKVKHVSDRAAAYGIPGRTLDGNQVEEVYHAADEALARARDGLGPSLLELRTYRFVGHSRSDPGHYRPAEEVAAWKQRDPITVYEGKLLQEGVLSTGQAEEIKAGINLDLDEAVARAESAPSPRPEDCLADVFA